MSFQVIIPARYASSRFPGKPLADLAGKPMVVRVCERAAQSGALAVHVATDDERIAAAVRGNGYRALITRAEHASGTDRLAEAAVLLGIGDETVVVNVQGDEPLVSPQSIAEVAHALSDRGVNMATACHRIHEPATASNPNVVKVVMDAAGYALYFSRACIPYPREGNAIWYRHAGIYAYRAGFLKRFAALPESPLEKTEALEQLRALWHGERILVVVSKTEMAPGVDTPQDLEAVRRMLA